MESLLYGVGAVDPAVFGTVVGVLLGVGSLATYVPVHKSSRVDPVDVLREEQR